MGDPLAEVLGDLCALPNGEREAVLRLLSEAERESVEALVRRASEIVGGEAVGESFSPSIVARIRVAHGVDDAARARARMTAATCGALAALAGPAIGDAERIADRNEGSGRSLLGVIRNALVRGRGR